MAKNKEFSMKIRVLFICHGNICRSPMAEFILKTKVENLGIKDMFYIESAATSTEEIWGGKGNPIYPPAKAELRKHGIGKTAYTNFASKCARQVTKEDYNRFDFILCADEANIRNTIRIVGDDSMGKVQLLLDYAQYSSDESVNLREYDRRRSIADPWYSGKFDLTYKDICVGCDGFLEYLRDVKGLF